MDRLEAIELIKKIQDGRWDRNEPKPPRGNLAIEWWDDRKFSLGMEYGAMVVLMQVYGIGAGDL